MVLLLVLLEYGDSANCPSGNGGYVQVTNNNCATNGYVSIGTDAGQCLFASRQLNVGMGSSSAGNLGTNSGYPPDCFSLSTSLYRSQGSSSCSNSFRCICRCPNCSCPTPSPTPFPTPQPPTPNPTRQPTRFPTRA